MTYPHPVHVYRTASPQGDGGPGVPDEDADWGDGGSDGPSVPASAATVYDGPADVQDGQRTVRRLAEAGESETANALVYLPPSGAAAFSEIRVGDLVTTPVGSGEVAGLRQTDAALVVALTRSTPAVPEVLA